MSDNQTTMLQSLSKLKRAGKLRYWRGTIEIPETELHAICDEIQEEHDQAIAATLGEKPRDKTEEWLLKACNQAAQDYVAQLEQERDELKSKLEAATFGNEINGETSDGYHTFNELYHHRAVLFSVVVAANSGRAWKSKLHHDGTMYEGMFIVGVDTPQGQATYHYDVEPYWDMFWCKELERAPEWDGHTPNEAIERIGSLRDVVLKGPKGRR